MIFLKRILVLVILCFAVLFSAFECNALGLSAHSAIVIDGVTGDIIYEKNAHQKLPMASTTKIMTAICALENGKIDDMVKVHSSAVGVEGSSMYLGYDEIISLENLIYGLMLSSGNDAAVAIAIHISGSVEAFAELMNETARRIGVKNTNFKNPNGLDEDGHYTTAYDLAIITRYGLKNETFSKIVSTHNVKIPWQGKDYDRYLKNHNKLLNMYDGCNGVKTGFTKKSGRCLVSSTTKEGFQTIVVTLNAPNDWNDHISLFNYAYDNYESKMILEADEYLCSVNVADGVTKTIKAVAKSDFCIPVKNGMSPQIELKYDIPSNISAPVEFRQKIGKVEIYKSNSLIGEVDIVSGSSCAWVEPKSFLKYVKKIFQEFILMHRRTC